MRRIDRVVQDVLHIEYLFIICILTSPDTLSYQPKGYPMLYLRVTLSFHMKTCLFSPYILEFFDRLGTQERMHSFCGPPPFLEKTVAPSSSLPPRCTPLVTETPDQWWSWTPTSRPIGVSQPASSPCLGRSQTGQALVSHHNHKPTFMLLLVFSTVHSLLLTFTCH